MIYPCKNCKVRTEDCHSFCKAYNKFKTDLRMEKQDFLDRYKNITRSEKALGDFRMPKMSKYRR